MDQNELIEKLENLSKCQMTAMILNLIERMSAAEEKIQKMEDTGSFS